MSALDKIAVYEGRDDSPGALERTVDSIARLGERIRYPLTPNANWLRAGLKACLQGMVWFAEYLGITTALSVPEAERIKQDCRELFEVGRKAVDSTDPAYRICPTFEQLTVICA